MLAGIAAAAVLLLLAAVYLAVYVWVRFGPKEPYLCDEIHTIQTDDTWQIKLYRYLPKDDAPVKGEPVLLCHGMLTNRRNFEIPEDDNLSTYLSDAGYDVWLIEYRGCLSGIPAEGQRKSDVTFDDYLLYDMPAAIDYIRVATRYPQIHIVGHSMGGMLIYAFDQMFGPAALASAVTIAAPTGFDDVQLPNAALLLAIQKRSHAVVLEAIRVAIPFMSVFRLSLRFLPMNWRNVSHNVTMQDFCHALDYIPHNVLAELDRISQTREWRMDAGHLDVKASLSNIQTPLFAIFGVLDPFVPVETAQRFFDALEQKDKRLLILSEDNGHSADYNHVDIAFGPESAAEVYEPIRQWLAQHAIERSAEAAPMTGERSGPAPLAGAYLDAELAYVPVPANGAEAMPEDVIEPPVEIGLPLPDVEPDDDEDDDEASWEEIPIAVPSTMPGAEEYEVDYDEVLARAAEAMKALEKRAPVKRGPTKAPAKKSAAAKKSSAKTAAKKKPASRKPAAKKPGAKPDARKQKTAAKKKAAAPNAQNKSTQGEATDAQPSVSPRQTAALQAARDLLEGDAPKDMHQPAAAKEKNTSAKKAASKKPASRKSATKKSASRKKPAAKKRGTDDE